VSRGEIEQACRRPIPPSTLDAVKRRGGAMFGDCQGNLCAVDVARIVAAERGVTITAIEKGPRGSRLFVGTSTERSQPLAPAPVPAGPVDAVVIGRGEAGRAAAAAIGRAGWRAAVLDRLDGPTVIGLSPMPEGWSVLAVDDTGSVEIACRSVVLATGGYVEPREHRGIAGPRPAGVITADFAAAARRSGLCVGEEVVVVGSTRRAAALAAGYERDRALVEVIGTQPDEVRGRTRLESVRVGGRWIACDTLILADRVIPNAMLLRSVGLVDGRPGIAAPADAHGRLPLPGLWAVGCCVKPSIDHETCHEDGERVGESVAASLAEAARA
jgi:hypothetical protein